MNDTKPQRASMKVGRVKIHLGDELQLVMLQSYVTHVRRFRDLRGCVRCKTLCVDAKMLCTCCVNYAKSKTYPDDDKGHVTLMPVSEFLTRADGYIARATGSAAA